jgi:hypothetical protein
VAGAIAVEAGLYGNNLVMTNDDQRKTPETGTDPGVTTWPDDSKTTADTTTGDLHTETGEQLYRETNQHGEPLENARPKP